MKKYEKPKNPDINSKSELKPNMDFYIINAINATKKNFDTFKCIGTLIADEVHVMATDKLSQAFYYVQPRYCLGLSATPYRIMEWMNYYFHILEKNKFIENKPRNILCL